MEPGEDHVAKSVNGHSDVLVMHVGHYLIIVSIGHDKSYIEAIKGTEDSTDKE